MSKKEECKGVQWGRPGNSVKIGLVGMPNVGKSSTFNLLGALKVAAENYPFCTIDPANTCVEVPDKRFAHLVQAWRPKSEINAVLTVTDIAGLVKGAAEGNGLGNAFLSHIQAVDAIYHVSRAFLDKDIEHVEGAVDPTRDFNIISSELVKKDQEFVANALTTLKKSTRAKVSKEQQFQLDTLEKAVAHLAKETGNEMRRGDFNDKEKLFLNPLNLLTAKPVVFLVNISKKNYITLKNKFFVDIKKWLKANAPGDKLIPYSVKFEEDIADMEEDEREAYLKENKTQSMLPRIIKAGYVALRCIHYFTSGPDEVRAWTIREGMAAPKAAGVIHTDFEKKFIKAKVYNYEDFKAADEGKPGADTEKAVGKNGKLREQGKAYIVQDGDIMHFMHG